MDVTKPADLALLTGTLASAMANPNYHFTLPYSTFNASGATLAQALRPFPQFGDIGDLYEHDGNWWYDALQIKVTKRISNGLSGGVGYRGRRIWGLSEHRLPLTPLRLAIQDPSRPPKSQKSFEGIDQPQMLNFYFNYEVPNFGFDQKGWKRALFAGWTADGNFHYQAVFPDTEHRTAIRDFASATYR